MGKDCILAPQIEEILLKKKISDLLNILNEDNKQIVSCLIIETIKLAYFRQIKKGDKTLNNKEVAFLLKLSFFHQTRKTEFNLGLSDPLRILFGIPKESNAQEWFIDNIVTKKKIIDTYKREIIIKEGDIDCIYKDEETQQHIVKTENYRIERAKRIPWIPLTIEQTKEIYRLNKPGWGCEDFFYVGTFNVVLRPDTQKKEILLPHINYYVVVARRKYKLKEIEFVTAYPIFDYLTFLKYIERWEPFEDK